MTPLAMGVTMHGNTRRFGRGMGATALSPALLCARDGCAGAVSRGMAGGMSREDAVTSYDADERFAAGYDDATTRLGAMAHAA